MNYNDEKVQKPQRLDNIDLYKNISFTIVRRK